MQDRSWLVWITERNHFQAALWRQKTHASCFFICCWQNKMLTLCRMKAINQNHFQDSLKKMLSWTDHFKQLGLTGSNGWIVIREMILHYVLYVAKLSRMWRLALRHMQKNVFCLINLVIVYVGIFSWSWRNGRTLHITIR